MGRRSRTGVLKRLREVKKAEKAAHKREEREVRREAGEERDGDRVATKDDLAGYGFDVEPADEDRESTQ